MCQTVVSIYLLDYTDGVHGLLLGLHLGKQTMVCLGIEPGLTCTITPLHTPLIIVIKVRQFLGNSTLSYNFSCNNMVWC